MFPGDKVPYLALTWEITETGSSDRETSSPQALRLQPGLGRARSGPHRWRGVRQGHCAHSGVEAPGLSQCPCSQVYATGSSPRRVWARPGSVRGGRPTRGEASLPGLSVSLYVGLPSAAHRPTS